MDFTKGPTSKKTEKTREIQGFYNFQSQSHYKTNAKIKPRARISMNFIKTLDANETSLDENFWQVTSGSEQQKQIINKI